LSLPILRFSSLRRPPPPSTLFPYTTLFRSGPLVSRLSQVVPRRSGFRRHQLSAGGNALREPPVRGGGRRVRAHRLRLPEERQVGDRKSTRLNSSHVAISYAVFCLKKKKQII